jgi:outer membrane receptor protein involved in Fe transport
MNKGLLLMGLFLLTLCAAPAGAAQQEGAAPAKEAIPATQEAENASKEATPAKKEVAPKVKEQAIPEVVVESERLVEKQDQVTIKAEGLPAEVTVLTKKDVEKTPYTGDITQIFRPVPGMYVASFVGYTPPALGMRGFKSWRGSQTGIFIDGVPMNQAQGPSGGQAEITWLIPEMIERVEVIKGPFSALYGDFALCGAINIITKKSDPSPSLAGYGGTYGTCRGVGIISCTKWQPSEKFQVTPFLVYEGFSQDGYMENSKMQRGNLFNKVTIPLWQGNLSMRLHYFQEYAKDPGMIPVDWVKSGRISRRDSLDGTGRNDADQFDLVLNYSPKKREEGFYASLFYTHNRFSRCYIPSTTLQYRNDYSINYYGWKLMYNYLPWDCLSIIAGNDLQHNETAGRNMYSTHYWNITGIYSHYHVRQFSTGFFGQAQYKPFSFLKIIGGLRYDLFNIDVNNILTPANSGCATPSVFSPKIGIVITPYKDINIFANRGQGFRSPHATELSPKTGISNFNLDVSKIDTYDVGFNALLFNRVYFAFDYYNTKLQREMMWNSTTYAYENYGNSVRDGIELELKLFVTKELTLYGNYSYVRARLTNPRTVGQYFITNLSPVTATVGFEYNKRWGKDYRLGANFYYLLYNRAPVNTAGTIIQPQMDRYFTKLSFGYKKWTATLDAAFAPRTYAAEYMAVYNGLLSYDPYPKWELMAGLRYQY